MTQATTDEVTTGQTQYRVFWRAGNSEEIGQSAGLYSEAVARIWVNSLNADKDNRAVGLVYWMEEEASSDWPGPRPEPGSPEPGRSRALSLSKGVEGE